MQAIDPTLATGDGNPFQSLSRPEQLGGPSIFRQDGRSGRFPRDFRQCQTIFRTDDLVDRIRLLA